MNLTQAHQEIQEMLPAAALQILEPEEVERVLAHVSGCHECTRELQEYQDAAAALSLQVPQRHLDPFRARAVRARLMARAHAERSAGAGAKELAGRLPANPAVSLILRWSGWMVAAGLAGVVLVHHSIHRPLDYGWLAAGVLVVVLIGLGIYARVQRGRVSALEDRLADLTATKSHTGPT